MKIDDLVEKALSRRSFLAGAGAAAAGTALAGCGDSSVTPPPASFFNDQDLLVFALNLEYLEAEFYNRAALGTGLPVYLIQGTTDGTNAATIGTPGTVTLPTTPTSLQVSANATLTTAQKNTLIELAYNETQHVSDLRSVLGTLAPCRPALDLTFFSPLAVAAGVANGATFSPFTSLNNFFLGSFIFEDVGVTAYSGLASQVSGGGITSGVFGSFTDILAVEAYHAAYARTSITAADVAAKTSTLTTAANQISTLRAKLSGGGESPLVFPVSTGLGTAASTTTASGIAPGDSNALAYSRSTDQVLHIVYGSATVGVSSGGFFPQGINCRFSVTKS